MSCSHLLLFLKCIETHNTKQFQPENLVMKLINIFNDIRHGGIAAHFQVIIERGILSFMTGYTLIFTTI